METGAQERCRNGARQGQSDCRVTSLVPLNLSAQKSGKEVPHRVGPWSGSESSGNAEIVYKIFSVDN